MTCRLYQGKTIDFNVYSDIEETLNVYNYTYAGPQIYSYEPAMHRREQGREELMAKH